MPDERESAPRIQGMAPLSANLTRANVTGKVPRHAKRSPRKLGKRVKMSSQQKRHVSNLQNRGVISTGAAARHGMTGPAK